MPPSSDPGHAPSGRVSPLFSRRGSYAVWAYQHERYNGDHARPGWHLRWYRDVIGRVEAFRLSAIVGQREVELSPMPLTTAGLLRFEPAPGAMIELAFASNDEVRIRGRGCKAVLDGFVGKSYSAANQLPCGTWELQPTDSLPRFGLAMRAGPPPVVRVHRQQSTHHSSLDQLIAQIGDGSGAFEASLRIYNTVPPAKAEVSFDDAVRAAEADHAAFAAMFACPPSMPRNLFDQAVHMLWNSEVHPHGLYARPVVLASKDWMARIWSWDHALHAVGIGHGDMRLAEEQLLLMEQMMDPASGQLCDALSTLRWTWLCTKNPVHGWAATHLIRNGGFTDRARLELLYELLRKWAGFWLGFRAMDPSDGLPCILNQNESFDNTTHTMTDGPCKAPDIAAYVVLLCEALAAIARRLGLAEAESRRWDERGRAVLDAMLRVLWHEERGHFVARQLGNGAVPEGDCVFNFVPLLLGRRLPEPVARRMVIGLARPGRFLTPWGLATEALDSSWYDPKTYVKGPVWAPPNAFIFEGLLDLGERQLAGRILDGFTAACTRSGMNELFDAQTGEGRGDPHYCWTGALLLHMHAIAGANGTGAKS